MWFVDLEVSIAFVDAVLVSFLTSLKSESNSIPVLSSLTSFYLSSAWNWMRHWRRAMYLLSLSSCCRCERLYWWSRYSCRWSYRSCRMCWWSGYSRGGWRHCEVKIAVIITVAVMLVPIADFIVIDVVANLKSLFSMKIILSLARRGRKWTYRCLGKWFRLIADNVYATFHLTPIIGSAYRLCGGHFDSVYTLHADLFH